jgi:pectate lyase
MAWTAGCAGMAEPLPTLSVAPAKLSVSTKVGSSSTLPVSVINTGTNSVTVSQVVVNGKGFALAGATAPMTLAKNQTASFNLKFTPTDSGGVSGSVRFVTDAAHRPAMLPLNGAGSNTTPVVSTVQVSPAISTPQPGGTIKFAALIQGATANDSVTWSTTIGTITTAGVFTAPMAGGVGRVTAQSNADPSFSSSATVAVAGSTTGTGSGDGTLGGSGSTGSVTAVLVTPGSAASATGGTLPFHATVQGSTTNTNVNWSAQLGTITSAGEYTAPAKAGTDVVTATSVADPTKSGVSTVKITAQGSSPTVTGVTVSPATTSVKLSARMQFSASVQGNVSNKGVSWTAALGTITSSGAYTAPSKAGTDTITATSEADTSMSAKAKVTVSAATTGSNPPPSTPNASANCPNSGCPAFPGAEGGGAESAGGRGGVVMEVTNLNDSGSGSLRACLEASGPRTCVFRVSGLITGKSRMQIRNPYITIAGQTAPGGGIVIGGPQQQGEQIFISTHDVVIRYLTYDGNNPTTATGPDGGTVGFELASGNIYNVVLDHISGRWWGNKPFLALSNDAGNVHDISYQWIMCYEPNAGHPVGPMADATSGSARNSVNIDWHHSFFANTGHRLPLVDVGSMRWVNNIVYNWDYYAALTWGGAKMDYIGNKYVPGNLNSGNGNHEFDSNPNNDDPSDQADNCIGGNPCDNPGPPSLYLVNNLGPHNSSVTTSPNDSGQKAMTQQGWEGGDRGGNIPNSWFRSSPLQGETFPIQADSVSDLDNVMLNTVGNSQHLDCSGNFLGNRDSQDARVIAQYKAGGSGNFFTGQFSAPSIASGSPCTESQHDGIPDQWKQLNGLSTSDSTLYKQTAPNGFTYLENYLNGTSNN